MHFDSSDITLGDYSYRLRQGVNSFQIKDDTDNFDCDASTDKFLLVTWADLSGDGWPYSKSQPAVLFAIPIEAESSFGGTNLKFTSAGTAAGYELSAKDIVISSLTGDTGTTSLDPRLDVDGDGKVDAFSDRFLIVRYALGNRGAPLLENLISIDATRTTPEEIEAFLEELMPEHADD